MRPKIRPWTLDYGNGYEPTIQATLKRPRGRRKILRTIGNPKVDRDPQSPADWMGLESDAWR